MGGWVTRLVRRSPLKDNTIDRLIKPPVVKFSGHKPGTWAAKGSCQSLHSIRETAK